MNQKIILQSRPNQTVLLDNFRYLEADIEPLQDGQVLVLNRWLSLDPYVRGRMSERKSYAPPMALGDVVIGEAIGEVISSNSHLFKTGDQVIGMLGWQTHTVMNESSIKPIASIAIPETWLLGAAGMPGITAWIGMMEICKPKNDETILLTSAAGSVGGIAGQLAKLQGAKVIGVAGSEAKCKYVMDHLNFDQCLSYKSADWQDALKMSAPDGINCLFDNVGGHVFDCLLEKMSPFSRIAICGLIAEGLADHFHQINLRALLANRILIQGFIVSDHILRWREIQNQLVDLLLDKKIHVDEKITEGLENAPQAFINMLEGRYFGKQLIRLS